MVTKTVCEGTQARLSTVPEALRKVPVSREHFYRLLKAGKLPSYRMGGKILVDVDEIIRSMRYVPE
jgi:excisionase family DNA binding protein